MVMHKTVLYFAIGHVTKKTSNKRRQIDWSEVHLFGKIMTQNTGTTELHGGLEKMENHHSLWTSSSSSEWKKSNPQIQHVCVSSDWFQTNFPNDISLNMHLFYNLISEFKKAGVFVLWWVVYRRLFIMEHHLHSQ